jgi:hypothetical protein
VEERGEEALEAAEAARETEKAQMEELLDTIAEEARELSEKVEGEEKEIDRLNGLILQSATSNSAREYNKQIRLITADRDRTRDRLEASRSGASTPRPLEDQDEATQARTTADNLQKQVIEASAKLVTQHAEVQGMSGEAQRIAKNGLEARAQVLTTAGSQARARVAVAAATEARQTASRMTQEALKASPRNPTLLAQLEHRQGDAYLALIEAQTDLSMAEAAGIARTEH